MADDGPQVIGGRVRVLAWVRETSTWTLAGAGLTWLVVVMWWYGGMRSMVCLVWPGGRVVARGHGGKAGRGPSQGQC